jgi:predicted amidohydrolase YtcJ
MAQHFHNGTIYSTPYNQVPELFVNDEGKVCSEQQYLDSTSKERIDLKEKVLIPSFRDGHLHPLLAGREARGLDVTKAGTVTELGLLLKDHIEQNPGLTWLDAGTYNRGIAGEQTCWTLDEFVSSIPVILHADDHHTIWVNSLALEVAGISKTNIPEFAIGGIDVDDKGSPVGILRESLAKEMILSKAPKQTASDGVEAMLLADQLLLASGITEAQDAWVDADILQTYLDAETMLQLDYKLAIGLTPETLSSDLAFAITAKEQLVGNARLSAHSVKIFVDGVFGSATAAVSQPYLTTLKTGDLNWSFDALCQALTFAKTENLQPHLHAIGDAGVEFALDAIESSGVENAVIAHAELVSNELLLRAKVLKVTCCVQPYWAQRNDLLLTCMKHLGEKRLNDLYAFKSMLQLGIPVVFSSDWPVSSYKPLEGIGVAVFRQRYAEQAKHNPEQALSMQEALTAYTSSVAKMLNSGTGELTFGSDFDAQIISADLNSQDLESFSTVEVLAVYKSGVRLFPHHQDR